MKERQIFKHIFLIQYEKNSDRAAHKVLWEHKITVNWPNKNNGCLTISSMTFGHLSSGGQWTTDHCVSTFEIIDSIFSFYKGGYAGHISSMFAFPAPVCITPQCPIKKHKTL